MHFLRNILFLFCFWSIGSTLCAASARLLDPDDAYYIDPTLPVLQNNFGQELPLELDLQFSCSFSPAILEQTVFTFSTESSCVQRTAFHLSIRKQYLFTFSGTSPPSVS